MEWVRRTYRSKWRLYKGRPDIEVEGRYYEVPDGTPVYPGWHFYGSRNWEDGELQHDVILGEVRGIQQEWAAKEAPIPFPEIQVIGGKTCIEEGEENLPKKRYEWFASETSGDAHPVLFSLDWPIGKFTWPETECCLPILANDDVPILANDDQFVLAMSCRPPILATDDLRILANDDEPIVYFSCDGN